MPVQVRPRAQIGHPLFADGKDSPTIRASSKSRPPRTTPQAKPDEGRDLARSIWIEAAPLAETLGEAYLTQRACTVPAPEADLRFHPRLVCAKIGRELPRLCSSSFSG